MADTAPGQVVKLGVWRHGQAVTASVCGRRAARGPQGGAGPKPDVKAQGSVQLQGLGLTVGAIDDVARQKFKPGRRAEGRGRDQCAQDGRRRIAACGPAT
jgi:serine protease Do